MRNLDRIDLLKSLPRNSVCAEIGVFAGDFSREILKICEPEMLFLVDTFSGQITSGNENGENMRTLDMGVMKWKMATELARYPIRIVQCDSRSWLISQSQRITLDWAYLDTTHEYDRTYCELVAMKEAVKPWGFICGHDYHPDYGAKRAVDEFVEHYGLELEVFDGDKLPSFKILNRPAV